MSRLGKLPILIPKGVEIRIEQNVIFCKGAKGQLQLKFDPRISIARKNSKLWVSLIDDKKNKALWGTTRQLVANMILGVTEGFEKKLEFKGVGFRASVQGKKLMLDVGFSHQVEVDIPEGIDVKVEKNIISVSGIDKQLVGQIAAEIRAIKPVEPYKETGLKYVGEHVQRKAGKKAVAVEGT